MRVSEQGAAAAALLRIPSIIGFVGLDLKHLREWFVFDLVLKRQLVLFLAPPDRLIVSVCALVIVL